MDSISNVISASSFDKYSDKIGASIIIDRVDTWLKAVLDESLHARAISIKHGQLLIATGSPSISYRLKREEKDLLEALESEFKKEAPEKVRYILE